MVIYRNGILSGRRSQVGLLCFFLDRHQGCTSTNEGKGNNLVITNSAQTIHSIFYTNFEMRWPCNPKDGRESPARISQNYFLKFSMFPWPNYSIVQYIGITFRTKHARSILQQQEKPYVSDVRVRGRAAQKRTQWERKNDCAALLVHKEGSFVELSVKQLNHIHIALTGRCVFFGCDYADKRSSFWSASKPPDIDKAKTYVLFSFFIEICGED